MVFYNSKVNEAKPPIIFDFNQFICIFRKYLERALILVHEKFQL